MAEKIFKEGMDVPANIEDMKSAPAPLGKKELMDKVEIGKPSDVTPAQRKKVERDMKMASDPIKKAGGGSASSRADGCCARGKTRGKMVMMG